MPTNDDNPAARPAAGRNSGPAARVAVARDEAEEAGAAEAKASKAVLEKLLRQSVEKRFAAFEGESGN